VICVEERSPGSPDLLYHYCTYLRSLAPSPFCTQALSIEDMPKVQVDSNPASRDRVGLTASGARHVEFVESRSKGRRVPEKNSCLKNNHQILALADWRMRHIKRQIKIIDIPSTLSYPISSTNPRILWIELHNHLFIVFLHFISFSYSLLHATEDSEREYFLESVAKFPDLLFLPSFCFENKERSLTRAKLISPNKGTCTPQGHPRYARNHRPMPLGWDAARYSSPCHYFLVRISEPSWTILYLPRNCRTLTVLFKISKTLSNVQILYRSALVPDRLAVSLSLQNFPSISLSLPLEYLRLRAQNTSRAHYSLEGNSLLKFAFKTSASKDRRRTRTQACRYTSLTTTVQLLYTNEAVTCPFHGPTRRPTTAPPLYQPSSSHKNAGIYPSSPNSKSPKFFLSVAASAS
jgi:hypothetical protein